MCEQQFSFKFWKRTFWCYMRVDFTIGSRLRGLGSVRCFFYACTVNDTYITFLVLLGAFSLNKFISLLLKKNMRVDFNLKSWFVRWEKERDIFELKKMGKRVKGLRYLQLRKKNKSKRIPSSQIFVKCGDLK